MAIHGLKSELEWPRYHENRDYAPIDAPQTSESHNFWSDRWIFKIHTFSKIGSQNLSKGIKINPIHGLLKVAALEGLPVALQGRLPRKVCQGYKRPQAPFRLEQTTFFWIFISTWMLSAHFSSLPNTKKHTKTHIKAFWFFFLHQKYKILFLYPIFFSLVLYLGIWGFGVWI